MLQRTLLKHLDWKIKTLKAAFEADRLAVRALEKEPSRKPGKSEKPHTPADGLSGYLESLNHHAAFNLEAGKIAAAINAGQYGHGSSDDDLSKVFHAATVEARTVFQYLQRQADRERDNQVRRVSADNSFFYLPAVAALPSRA